MLPKPSAGDARDPVLTSREHHAGSAAGSKVRRHRACPARRISSGTQRAAARPSTGALLRSWAEAGRFGNRVVAPLRARAEQRVGGRFATREQLIDSARAADHTRERAARSGSTVLAADRAHAARSRRRACRFSGSALASNVGAIEPTAVRVPASDSPSRPLIWRDHRPAKARVTSSIRFALTGRPSLAGDPRKLLASGAEEEELDQGSGSGSRRKRYAWARAGPASNLSP